MSDKQRKLSEKICKPKGKQPVNFTEKLLKHENPSSAKLGRGGILVIEPDRIASEFRKHRNSDFPSESILRRIAGGEIPAAAKPSDAEDQA